MLDLAGSDAIPRRLFHVSSGGRLHMADVTVVGGVCHNNDDLFATGEWQRAGAALLVFDGGYALLEVRA
jgi:hypothetical protein